MSTTILPRTDYQMNKRVDLEMGGFAGVWTTVSLFITGARGAGAEVNGCFSVSSIETSMSESEEPRKRRTHEHIKHIGNYKLLTIM